MYSELQSNWDEGSNPCSFLQTDKVGSKANDFDLHLGGTWLEPRTGKSIVLIGGFRGLL
jgi:hypothetical protein